MPENRAKQPKIVLRTGEWAEFPLPNPMSGPSLAAVADHKVWFGGLRTR